MMFLYIGLALGRRLTSLRPAGCDPNCEDRKAVAAKKAQCGGQTPKCSCEGWVRKGWRNVRTSEPAEVRMFCRKEACTCPSGMVMGSEILDTGIFNFGLIDKRMCLPPTPSEITDVSSMTKEQMYQACEDSEKCYKMAQQVFDQAEHKINKRLKTYLGRLADYKRQMTSLSGRKLDRVKRNIASVERHIQHQTNKRPKMEGIIGMVGEKWIKAKLGDIMKGWAAGLQEPVCNCQADDMIPEMQCSTNMLDFDGTTCKCPSGGGSPKRTARRHHRRHHLNRVGGGVMPGTTTEMPGTTTEMPGTTTDMPGTDMPETVSTEMPGTSFTDMPESTDMPMPDDDDMSGTDMPETGSTDMPGGSFTDMPESTDMPIPDDDDMPGTDMPETGSTDMPGGSFSVMPESTDMPMPDDDDMSGTDMPETG